MPHKPFGKTIGSSGSTNSPFQYGGTSGYQNWGDAGLYHVGARSYDPQVGRFISRDTYLDQSPYLYCDGDPVNAADPSAHQVPGEFYKELVGSVKGSVGGVSVGGAIGGIVEENTPKGSLPHGIGGTLAGGATFVVGIGLVAAGAVATAPIVIIGATIVGTGLACVGVVHAIGAWTDRN